MEDARPLPYSPQEQGMYWYQRHLPSDRSSWPGDSEVEAYVQSKKWKWPGRRLFFLSDLHADTDAFLLSLIATGGIVKTGPEDADFDLTDNGKTALFMIGGDCFDKGPQNLRLLEVIGQLYEKGASVELLAGNHDVRTFIGIQFAESQEPLTAHLFTRMGRKTAPFLKEIYDGFVEAADDDSDVDEIDLEATLFPRPSWFDEFPRLAAGRMSHKKLVNEVRRIEEKAQDLRQHVEALGMDLRQVYLAVRKFRELFFAPSGRFHWFFANMKLAHREGSYLFVHGGLDDVVAELIGEHGVDHLNREFTRVLREDPFELYHGELGNVMRTKYRDTDHPFTSRGAGSLEDAGIDAIVHGHRSIVEGQRLVMREGILNFECDASVDRNSRKERGLEGLGAAAVVFTESGEINGISTDYPAVKSFHPDTEIVTGTNDAD